MPDAITKIADVLVPSKFLPYMQERTAQLSAFQSSGVIESAPELDTLVSGGGKTFDIPFWQDIAGPNQSGSNVLSDSAALETKKISASEQIAIAHQRGEAWAANSMVKLLTAEDPMAAIADRIAAYWAIDEQTMLIKTADGVFADNAANDSGDLINNIAAEATGSVSDATKVSAEAIIDAEAKLGDAGKKLGAIAMHSQVYYRLKKQSLIDFIPAEDGKSQIAFYQGKRVIVDDALSRAGTTSGTVYKTFLFAGGAFQKGEKLLTDAVDGGFGSEGLEMARQAKSHISEIISRRRFILHPHGTKFTSSSLAGKSPTDAELATAANWDRVFEKKNLRIVLLLTN